MIKLAKKKSNAEEIRDYFKSYPDSKAKHVAKATGSSEGYVYEVLGELIKRRVYKKRKKVRLAPKKVRLAPNKSDGSTAAYYELPKGATELQHLISKKDMNAQIGEIFRSCYRYGESSHSDKLRDAKKIRFYIDAEIERLSK
tara:strand:+ start:905 stop:1330 length:426 start_codon:yes stop_codon:yes gene_type:complete